MIATRKPFDRQRATYTFRKRFEMMQKMYSVDKMHIYSTFRKKLGQANREISQSKFRNLYF